MDRRRRPVSSEGRLTFAIQMSYRSAGSHHHLTCLAEVDYWARTYQSMASLSKSASSTNLSDTVHRVNRLISAWPTDDMPPDGIAGVKELHKKLASGLNDIKANSERDAE